MTHEDKGRFAQKHGPESRPQPAVVAAVRGRSVDETIGCAEAFEVAAELGVTPAEVGLAIDTQEITIMRCQLGLYGYKPGRSIVKPALVVSDELEVAIRAGLVDGRLPCAAAWGIAEQFGIAKLAVSSACEKLGVRISACQLGAF